MTSVKQEPASPRITSVKQGPASPIPQLSVTDVSLIALKSSPETHVRIRSANSDVRQRLTETDGRYWQDKVAEDFGENVPQRAARQAYRSRLDASSQKQQNILGALVNPVAFRQEVESSYRDLNKRYHQPQITAAVAQVLNEMTNQSPGSSPTKRLTGPEADALVAAAHLVATSPSKKRRITAMAQQIQLLTVGSVADPGAPPPKPSKRRR